MASHQQLNICHRGWFPIFIFFSILQTCVKFQVIYPGCTDYIPEVKIVIAQSSRSFETATCTIHLKSLVTLPGLHFLNIAFLIRLFPYRLPTSNTYNPLQLKLSWFIRLVPQPIACVAQGTFLVANEPISIWLAPMSKAIHFLLGLKCWWLSKTEKHVARLLIYFKSD